MKSPHPIFYLDISETRLLISSSPLNYATRCSTNLLANFRKISIFSDGY